MERLHCEDEDNLTAMFQDLKDRVKLIEEKVNNPVCKWAGCGLSFKTIDELHEHCATVHANNSSGNGPAERTYKCQWIQCTRQAFRQHAHLCSHLYEHTGREEDAFLLLLIQDQAKCLTRPKANMRWHPAVIRWCLQQHARSTSAYEEMRQAGFLRLPTSRTLQVYATYSEPKSGWVDEALQANPLPRNELLTWVPFALMRSKSRKVSSLNPQPTSSLALSTTTTAMRMQSRIPWQPTLPNSISKAFFQSSPSRAHTF